MLTSLRKILYTKFHRMLERNPLSALSEKKKENLKDFLDAYKSYEIVKKDVFLSEEKKATLREYYRALPPKDIDRLFSLYRDYLKHEDGLINNRATWLVGVQSFLIATFGFSYQKKIEIVARAIEKLPVGELKGSIVLFDFSLLLLVIIGIYSSYAAILSIRAAVEAIDELQRKWEDEIIPHCQMFHHLPSITGGGIHKSVSKGAELALKLPVFFLRFWTVVAGFGFIGFGYDLWIL